MQNYKLTMTKTASLSKMSLLKFRRRQSTREWNRFGRETFAPRVVVRPSTASRIWSWVEKRSPFRFDVVVVRFFFALSSLGHWRKKINLSSEPLIGRAGKYPLNLQHPDIVVVRVVIRVCASFQCGKVVCFPIRTELRDGFFPCCAGVLCGVWR